MMRSFIVGVLVLFLSGCSVFGDRFSNRANQYPEANEGQPLLNAEGFPALIERDGYPIPSLPVAVAVVERQAVPRPAPFVGHADTDSVASLNEFRNQTLNARMGVDGAGTQVLYLDVPFAYAWAQVTDAIVASELELTDLNRSVGTYYLAVMSGDVEDDRSWWGRLWRKAPEPSIQIMHLKMHTVRSGVYLSLLTDADNLADERTTEAVLQSVQRQFDR